MKTIRVGTRGSKLALTQTEQVIERLRAIYHGLNFEAVVIKTTGDMRAGVAFEEVGTKGMFVKEIEEALLAGEVDFAVHSLKDMPGEVAKGLCISSIPKREDARDALVSRGIMFDELATGAIVGTSSPRRQALLRAARPDLALQPLRGNLDTRLRKLDEGQYDAIVLACAGLDRLGFADRIAERLPIAISVPAPGQGALALETRTADEGTQNILAVLSDQDTSVCVSCERSFQQELNAGCSVPAGAYAVLDGGDLRLTAVIAAPDGSALLKTEVAGRRTDASMIGKRAALELLERGGRRWLG